MNTHASSPSAPLPAAAVLLSAGESRRMGSPKALLPWEGGTFFGTASAAIQAVGFRVSVAVVNPEIEKELPELSRFGAVLRNEEPERGQLFSLQIALHWLLRSSPGLRRGQ